MINFNDLPFEIQEKMLEYQEKQGNPKDRKVYGGIDFSKTPEGTIFWIEVLRNRNYDLFFKQFNNNKNDTRKITEEDSRESSRGRAAIYAPTRQVAVTSRLVGRLVGNKQTARASQAKISCLEIKSKVIFS